MCTSLVCRRKLESLEGATKAARWQRRVCTSQNKNNSRVHQSSTFLDLKYTLIHLIIHKHTCTHTCTDAHTHSQGALRDKRKVETSSCVISGHTAALTSPTFFPLSLLSFLHLFSVCVYSSHLLFSPTRTDGYLPSLLPSSSFLFLKLLSFTVSHSAVWSHPTSVL